LEPQARRWIVQGLIGVAVGLVLGFLIGWWILPVEYTNTPPSVLRRDYRDEYIVMVATAYGVEGDLDQARERLAALDPDNPAAPVIELAERLVATGSDSEDLARLARLAQALDAITPLLIPYLEDQS
jgi:hypothetical protein